ncbi:MAG: glutathione peroxidase [Clostridia bacterium]|nr:glutathione peroxidase [Clostridia bacterium]
MSVYDFSVKDRSLNEVSLSEYKGKVLLIVNTATGCGFTPQYKGLEELYRKYKDQGFEILDFPCNQFFHQAPGNDEEIHSFCTLKYDTTFPRFHKIDVNGNNADPLYVYLTTQNKNGKTQKIKWNFTKFLISKNGEVIDRFSPMTKPEKIDKYIKKALEE